MAKVWETLLVNLVEPDPLLTYFTHQDGEDLLTIWTIGEDPPMTSVTADPSQDPPDSHLWLDGLEASLILATTVNLQAEEKV